MICSIKTVSEIDQELGVHQAQVVIEEGNPKAGAFSLFDTKRGLKLDDPSANPKRDYSGLG